MNNFGKKMFQTLAITYLVSSLFLGNRHSEVQSSCNPKSYDPKGEELRKKAEQYGSVGESLMVLYHNNGWLKKGLSGRDPEIKDEIEFRLRIIPESAYDKLPQEFKDVVDEGRALMGEDVLGKGIPPEVVEEFHKIPYNRQHFAKDFMKSVGKNNLEATVEDLRNAYNENVRKYGTSQASKYDLDSRLKDPGYKIP